jgi:hypothetical protein
MNKINTIATFSPAVSRDFTIDKELIASREQKVKVLVGIAFGCLYASIFSSSARRFAIMASPVNMGLFFLLSLGASYAAIKFISSRFAQWDENRARNDLTKTALICSHDEAASQWLVNNEEPAVMKDCPFFYDALFAAAVQQEKPAWLRFVWKDRRDVEKSNLIKNYSQKLIAIDSDFFSADITAEQERITTMAMEKLKFSLPSLSKEDAEAVPDKIVIDAYKETQSPYNKTKIFECLIHKTEALRLLLGRDDFTLYSDHSNNHHTPKTLFDVAIDMDNCDAYELFIKYFYRKNLRPSYEYINYAFIRSFKNVNDPKLPWHLINKNMILPYHFFPAEEFFIIAQCISPFNPENVIHNYKTCNIAYRKKIAADADSKSDNDPSDEQTYRQYLLSSRDLLFECSEVFPLRECYNCKGDLDERLKLLVNSGFNLNAKNTKGLSVKEFFTRATLSQRLTNHLNKKRGFKHHAYYVDMLKKGIDIRCNFSDELIKINDEKQASLEKLDFYSITYKHARAKERAIVYHVLTQNLGQVGLVQDIYRHIMALYEIYIPERWDSHNTIRDFNLPVF